MGNIDKIQLPNGNTYDINDTYKSGIYTVIGTQTASTASWTGALHGVSALYDGLTINYYLPYAGVASTNVTLNLTLDSGSTTGAKNCYINTSRLTTHYGAGRTIVMTYYSAGSISISGTATTDDRWICDAYYDTNSDTKVRQTLSTTNKNYPLLLSYAESSSTTTNIDNVSYRNNSIFANPSTGTIYSTNISVAPPADNATFPTGGYIAHDVRNVSTVPTTTGVNFIMTNQGTGISSSWYSGIYCKSSGGDYGAWELVGCALNADNRTKPFYVRNSNKTTAWGDWRKLYDTSNPPAFSEISSKPTTISGYGITDAKIASGVITLGSNTITPLTASSTLDATKLSGTIPSGCYTNTKNTAGSTDTSSKIFLIGATSQAANPQTYSDNEVYATSGVLTTKSVQVGGGSCTMQYNVTTQSCDFVFS